jgi:hypothetical protein
LSIDVDGQDYWIWEAIDPTFRPAIVVIECNAGFEAGHRRVEARGLAWSDEFGTRFGASVAALEHLGAQRGYRLVHVDQCGVNAFFVDHRVLDERGVEVQRLTDRSPNYWLNGEAHPPATDRPTVEIPDHG